MIASAKFAAAFGDPACRIAGRYMAKLFSKKPLNLARPSRRVLRLWRQIDAHPAF